MLLNRSRSFYYILVLWSFAAVFWAGKLVLNWPTWLSLLAAFIPVLAYFVIAAIDDFLQPDRRL